MVRFEGGTVLIIKLNMFTAHVTVIFSLLVSWIKQMSVNSSFNLKVSKSMLVNSCNFELGKTIGQGTYSYRRLVASYRKFHSCDFQILGEFGIVYRGRLKEAFHKKATETVAVKTLKGIVLDTHTVRVNTSAAASTTGPLHALFAY